MVKVLLENVTKKFGRVVAADHINLEVKHGEFFTFLGPSGCGKTTTLRLIAGLEHMDEGRISFDDEDVSDLPPYKRRTGMVFQNYALWPHMNVYDNVAYGLKIKKLPRDEVRERVTEVLRLVKLEGLENRRPTQLSGGQQQRVALARALVIQPRVLLLDEPLSNLDAKLRIETREEIKRLQRKLGITTIYVTHDQEEAMVISDRVAIMNKGRIVQVGVPYEIYNAPRDLFTSSFLGRCSILKGIITQISGNYVTVNVDGLMITGVLSIQNANLTPKREAYVILRPGDFLPSAPNTPYNTFVGTVEWTGFIGSYLQIRLRINDRTILVNVEPRSKVSIGSRIKTYIPFEYTTILPLREKRRPLTEKR